MSPPLTAVYATSFSARPSTELGHIDPAPDAERIKPKRSSSFGRGLGQLASLASTKPKTVDLMSFGRTKSGASTPQPPVPSSNTTDSVTAAATILANTFMDPPSTPDPSHLTQFSLQLSDLVNKAFVPCTAGNTPAASTTSVASNVAAAAKGATTPKINQITYDGKHLPDKAKIIEIAQTVFGELRYAESVDAYLLRAVSRQILKALTLFAARIDSLLVSPTKDPGALRIPTNAKEGLHLPAAMEFNLGLVTLEWIVEDSLERCIEGDRDAHGELIADENGAVHDGMPNFVSEILTPVRKRMEGTILHIIQPILAQTKLSMARCISTAVPTPFVSPVTLSPATTSGSATTAAALDSRSVSPPLAAAVTSAATPGAAVSGNVSPLRLPETGPGSAWLRDLDARLEGARRLLLPRIEERCGQDGEGWFISVAIHIIWKGLLILTSRSVSLPSNAASELLTGSNAASASAFDRLLGEVNQKRSPSPAQLAHALKSVGVGSTRSKSRSTDPLGHPNDSGRQSPSHCAASTIAPFSLVSARLCAHQLAELQTFEKLMLRFCDGFLRRPGTQTKKLGKESKRSRFALFSSGNSSLGGANQPLDLSAYDPDEEDELARAALAEAMHALRSTIIVLQSLEREPGTICAALEHLKSLPGAQDGVKVGDAALSNTATSNALGTEAAKALDAIPNLLLLQTLYNRLPMGAGRLELPSPPALFGYTWTEYEKAIAGFAGGEQWAQAVALRYKPEIEKAWRSIAVRMDEKLAASEHKLAGAKANGGAANTSRTVSGSSARAGSGLARGGSLHSSSGEEEEGDVPEVMSQSVPELKKPNGTTSRSSEEAQPNTSSVDVRGRPSPTHSPRRSSTLAHPEMAPSATVQPLAAASTATQPRFWRRSASTARSGFHFSFSGLRSQSPRAGTLPTPPTTTSQTADPLATASPTGSASGSNTNLASSTTADSPPRTAAGLYAEPTEEGGMSEEEQKIHLEAKVERKSLCVFAKALVYAGRGQVAIELR